MRSLCLLPCWLGRFVPCSIGANHCRLRHIGWERCGHGLTTTTTTQQHTTTTTNHNNHNHNNHNNTTTQQHNNHSNHNTQNTKHTTHHTTHTTQHTTHTTQHTTTTTTTTTHNNTQQHTTHNNLDSTWCTLYPLTITREDVVVWPYSVDILLEFSSFLASLHWPQGDTDPGKFGISYFELLLMFEIYVGHRLHAEKAVRPHLRPRRPCFFSGFPVGMGQEIRHRVSVSS